MHLPLFLPLLLAAPTLLAPTTAQSQESSLTIPAHCGYARPEPNAIHRDHKSGSVRSCEGQLTFYVELQTPGLFDIELERLANAPAQRLSMQFTKLGTTGGATLYANAPAITKKGGTMFRGLVADHPGMWSITLATTDGSAMKMLGALHLSGNGSKGATASTVERRNASSVHLWYDVPRAHQDDIEWFYCELTPKTDPLWTYYMATGWHRGYFGMQVNSKTERRIIFSVWDSGNEAVDRKKVEAADLVQLVAKGERVHADGFGNEGTGGHSHLVHDWQLGDTMRFVMRAQPDGKHTTYTGWFSHVHSDGKADDWQLVASFKAPRDGRFLHGLYSFSENFSGSNGDRDRQCDYGNIWLRSATGKWLAVRTAKFTHDGHGNKHRPDHRGGVRDGRFFLQHGNFNTPSMRRGTPLQLPGAPGQPPTGLLAKLLK